MFLKRIFNILLYVFVIIVPIMPLKSRLGSIPMAPDFVIGGLLIALGCIIFVIEFKNNIEKLKELLQSRYFTVLTILILLFGLFSFFSILYAGSKTLVISETMRFAEYVIIFYFMLIYCGKRECKNVIMLLLLSMLAAGFYGIVQFVLGTSEFQNFELAAGKGRVYSTFVNPNYWGAAVNLVIFLPICVILEKKGFSTRCKATSWVYFIIMFVNLILSLTKGSWLGFAIGAFIIFSIRYRRALLYLVAGTGVALLINKIRDYFVAALTAKTTSLSTRVTLWKTGLKMFEDHVFTGLGNGNYNYYYYEYVTKYPELYLGREVYTVHNSYIKMLAELGIFGMIGFTTIYFMLVGLAIKVYRNSTGTLKVMSLAMIGFWGAYLFQNFFNNLIFIPQLNVFVWIISAALYKYYLETRRESDGQICGKY